MFVFRGVIPSQSLTLRPWKPWYFPSWGPWAYFQGQTVKLPGGYLDPPCFCQWSEVPWPSIISPRFGTVRPIDLASLLYASGVFNADLWHHVGFLVKKKTIGKLEFFGVGFSLMNWEIRCGQKWGVKLLGEKNWHWNGRHWWSSWEMMWERGFFNPNMYILNGK